MTDSAPSPHPFITRCRLQNYRSIAACDVRLEPLTLLVGPNGSGKSNFLDALRLVSEALTTSLEHALRDRGGIEQVRRRSGGHPTHFSVALDITLPDGIAAAYRFSVGARRTEGRKRSRKGSAYEVTREQCQVGSSKYEVRSGRVELLAAGAAAGSSRRRSEANGTGQQELLTPGTAPPASDDRLYLVTAAGLPAFRALYDALAHMGFYNVQPERIRELQPPDKGELLSRDGRNLASVVSRMRTESPDAMQRTEEFLRRVVPGIEGVDHLPMGHMVTLEFRQRVEGASEPWRFPAINMSDGTLRVLAILVSLNQPGAQGRVPLVGIEEPETALHPAASGVLFDALRNATRHTQVLVTSHSPELLDHPSLRAEEILAVTSVDGRTDLGPMSEASRSALRDHLYSGGELLRADQIEPDRSAIPEPRQLRMFENWSPEE